MKKTLKRILLAAALFSLAFAGCTAKYHQEVLEPGGQKLEPGKGVFISVPEDGFYGTHQYPRSGEMTAQALKEGFARYTNQIQVSDLCRGEACLERISPSEYAYYAAPDILHWEERATEWSGLPDRIRVKVVIYDVESRSVMSSVILQGKSKWATFGGDHPQDLLPEPIAEYLKTVY
jgi:hypothetical protein